MRQYILFLFLIPLSACTVSYLDSGYLIPAAQEPVSMDFTMEEDLIIINAEVNGVRGKFLLDNGFSLSGIDPEFARKAQIKFKGKGNLRDANNKKLESRKTQVDTVRIQGQTFVKTGFYEIETSRFFPCYPLDGIIGASIMNKINWEIDFQTQRLRISSRPFDHPGFTWKVGFSDNNSNLVKLTVQGKTVNAKIDLGSSGGIKLDADHFKEVFSGSRMIKHEGIFSLSAGGLGEVATSYETVSPIPITHNGEVLPRKARIGINYGLKYPAYIGLEYLREYQLSINSTTRQYILSEAAQPTDAEDMRSYGVGIYLIDDHWYVIRKIANDPLMKSIRVMDEVAMLDGEPMNRFADICAYKAYLEKKVDRKEILTIVLKRSGEKLELPYRPNQTMNLP